ncbi:PAS domain S-box protein [Solemya pervernicosa gill symbiont]|uniref:PAS domain S-box protein n=1 Tax=Solemya pervernicosa gill symbiont TaxID=642797 RepID=A0A1T2LA18_9GAMM|nr:EAL domain-containing protein [Solemya pervernicosa gill symbiont]OOZ41945.1 PAS domain S-box protein [Solemya pervernicosa gill symbiont]
MDYEEKYAESITYIRAKIDQLLKLMGTLPLRPEELDDHTLIELDPIGIVAQSFSQVLQHLHETNEQLASAKDEIRTILDAINAAVVVIDDQGRVEEYNRLAHTLFFKQLESEQIIGHVAREICTCEEGIGEKVLKSLNLSCETVIDGRDFMVNATHLESKGGAPRRTVLLYTEITAQKQAEESLRLYEKVFDNTAEGILITDGEAKIVETNSAFTRITGYSLADLIGQRPSLLKSGRHDSEFYASHWKSLEESGTWKGEIIDRHKNGSLVPLLQTISKITDWQGQTTNYISILTDITSLKETQTRLDFLAHHDALTELPNRLLFHDRLDHAIERAERNDNKIGLLFIDLDRFKIINDSLGHDVGDTLLQQVARQISSLSRKSDTVARLGGDEFVILIENVTSDTACTTFANKIVHALKQPFDIDEHQLHIGCSIGISIYPDDGEDSVTLIKNADTAMYKVKESGRDGYHKYSSELSESAVERLTIENALRHALERQEFHLHYQPLIDCERQHVFGAEALLRWQCPLLGNVSPMKFIPIAEESSLIIPIGYWVFEESIRQYKSWRDSGIELDYISINVSGAQLYHFNFAETLIALMLKHGLTGDQIQIEITENIMMNDIDTCISILDQLRSEGFRVAIDDFGTGYSSLSYLRRLPIDMLKIDRSFVMHLPDNNNDCMIATAVVSLAKSLKLETVAEGIEDERQLDFLHDIGCNRFQGFHFSRPTDAEAFEQYWHRYAR